MAVLRTPGQRITFELEDVTREAWVDAQVTPLRNTVAKIAKYHGISSRVGDIKTRNGIRSSRSVLKRNTIKVPLPRTVAGSVMHVLAGDQPPRITSGYAKYDIVDRDQRAGLTRFQGYDPVVMEVPIRFEWQTLSPGGEPEGDSIEDQIAALERMAGRGIGSVNAIGRPGRVRVRAERDGKAVPLIPRNYQPNAQNPNPPVWVVSGIDWDDNPWRNSAGNRIRQLATVELTQYVSPVALGPLSVVDRSRARNQGKTKAKGKR